MATERTIQCIHYLHEGSCDLGKKKMSLLERDADLPNLQEKAWRTAG